MPGIIEVENKSKRFLEIPGVIGYVVVSNEDGTMISAGGKIPNAIDETVAFIGSASDVITTTLQTGTLDYVVASGDRNLLLVVLDKYFIGCVYNGEPEHIKTEILDLLKEGDKTGDPKILRLFKAKAYQLNLILEEFSRDIGIKVWETFISQVISAMDTEKKFQSLIKVSDGKIIPIGAINLTAEDVNKFMKVLIDAVVKHGVKKFGSEEAKKRVHNVIEKLGAAKKKVKNG